MCCFNLYEMTETLFPKKTYPFEVSPQAVDFNFQITLSSLTALLMTAAGNNAEENGFGMRQLNGGNNTWVLLRLAIEMNSFPKQYEQIYIETWIEGIGRVSTTRNFHIRDKNQKTIGYAASIWAMIDYNSRKPQDLLQFDNLQQFATDEKVPIDKPVKLKAMKGRLTDDFNAKYSHIDFNRHVNTMRYVEWISNCFTPDHYNNKKMKRFEINFMSEILFGDPIQIYLAEDEDKDTYFFEMCSRDKTSCRAKLIFVDQDSAVE